MGKIPVCSSQNASELLHVLCLNYNCTSTGEKIDILFATNVVDNVISFPTVYVFKLRLKTTQKNSKNPRRAVVPRRRIPARWPMHCSIPKRSDRKEL